MTDSRPHDSLLSPQWSGTTVAVLTSDETLLRECIRVEIAWLVAVGGNSSTLLPHLQKILDNPPSAGDLAAAAWSAGNPIVRFVEQMRQRLTDFGVEATAFHRGLTSQDVLDTALMAMVASVLDDIRPNLVHIGGVLTDLAERHRDTLCMATTLTQDAEVTSWGLRLAHWLDAVTTAHNTLSNRRASLPIQRGGAVGDGKSLTEILAEQSAANPQGEYEKVYDTFAHQLGLVNPGTSWHQNRQPVMQVVHAVAEAGLAMGMVAKNILHLGRSDIAEVVMFSPPGQGASSAMPHKQNPVHPLMVHSSGLRLPGIVAQIGACVLTIDERGDGQWNAEWEPLREALRLVGGQSHHLRQAMDIVTIDSEAAAQRLAHSSIPEKTINEAQNLAIHADIDRSLSRWREAQR